MYLNKEDLMKDGEMDVLSRRSVHALMLLMMINEAVCQWQHLLSVITSHAPDEVHVP